MEFILMHAMRRGSKTFLKAIFGKSNEQKEESVWGRLCDINRQLNEAEARDCSVFTFFYTGDKLSTAPSSSIPPSATNRKGHWP